MPSKTKTKSDIVNHDDRPKNDTWYMHLRDYSKMCPVCGPKILKSERVVLLYRSLREFGYSTINVIDVEQAYDIAMERKPTAEDGVIATLVRSQLVEAGLVKDE